MECVDWARFGLFFPFEIGKDEFPHPGKTVRWYRAQKKRLDATWTQKRLAQELDLTERAVYYLENHDVGLDSIALRRRLAILLTIPLVLFGLASLEDKTEPGQIVQQHRTIKPKNDPLRSQKGLARALSITDKAVRDMEKRNRGLDSITRRRVLVDLLAITPTALGITTLEELLLQQKAAPTIPPVVVSTVKAAILDPAFYEERLKTIWSRNHTNTAQDRLTQLATDIAGLATVLPYVRGNDEKEVQATLCRCHHLHAHILRDQGQYDAALAELEKAAILAERAEHLHLLAATHLRIGSVLRDRGDVTEALAKVEEARGNSTGANQKRGQAHADYTSAIGQYARILTLERISPALCGVASFDEGYAQAHLAHGNRDAIRASLTLLKRGGKIITETRGVLEDEFSIRITERTYGNTKAATLLAAGWPREALEVLSDVMSLPQEGDMTRQNAYTDYLWAQANADLGLIDAAATPAQDAFVIMKHIKSRIHIQRIAGLQGQLSQLDNKHIEVIRLGVMVNS